METTDFAELLLGSGVVLSDTIWWISFHRYDVQLFILDCGIYVI